MQLRATFTGRMVGGLELAANLHRYADCTRARSLNVCALCSLQYICIDREGQSGLWRPFVGEIRVAKVLLGKHRHDTTYTNYIVGGTLGILSPPPPPATISSMM
jgi:hypothetical protein